MAEVILVFDPVEERTEIEHAIYGSSYANLIFELDEWLRSQSKHECKTIISIDEVRKWLREMAEGLPLW